MKVKLYMMTLKLRSMILENSSNPVNKIEGGLYLASGYRHFVQDT